MGVKGGGGGRGEDPPPPPPASPGHTSDGEREGHAERLGSVCPSLTPVAVYGSPAQHSGRGQREQRPSQGMVQTEVTRVP